MTTATTKNLCGDPKCVQEADGAPFIRVVSGVEFNQDPEATALRRKKQITFEDFLVLVTSPSEKAGTYVQCLIIDPLLVFEKWTEVSAVPHMRGKFASIGAFETYLVHAVMVAINASVGLLKLTKENTEDLALMRRVAAHALGVVLAVQEKLKEPDSAAPTLSTLFCDDPSCDLESLGEPWIEMVAGTVDGDHGPLTSAHFERAHGRISFKEYVSRVKVNPEENAFGFIIDPYLCASVQLPIHLKTDLQKALWLGEQFGSCLSSHLDKIPRQLLNGNPGLMVSLGRHTLGMVLRQRGLEASMTRPPVDRSMMH